mmetsp:Transcript_1809/g.2504  ORF Transcript_1809/g.2504 Transcript_1809/m.2504 type:complete len:111 (+) Transcript_1809:122-454(+)|eukprot:CAMPEP_0118687176 /NCGR_PEP_ID=MMETSP0800-20121206/8234_1 /TAXON_ID=210618 ORGANISM="Striatella unipunctata, Strain CCMP2910" /NCGR_SAMPLE_ID=MMETSP0800 /ASSEMBLY_ACC=CAM_ASM_000638 /LENGTH=110 /DNA_ID=CAMNT_0006584325 /DNA_START=108 /DNA_END=440 /DNA_ORIENTATION=+
MAATSNQSGSTMMEVQETLARIRSHKTVEAACILTKEGGIIHSTWTEEQTNTHSPLLTLLTKQATDLVKHMDENDELTVLRVHSKHKEIMISAEKDYILIVLSKPRRLDE